MAHGSDEPTEAAGGELVRAGDPESMREWAEQLVARARAEGVELTGEDGLLTELVRQVLQTGLEVEMAEHLGYERRTSRPGAARATAATAPTPRR